MCKTAVISVLRRSLVKVLWQSLGVENYPPLGVIFHPSREILGFTGAGLEAPEQP